MDQYAFIALLALGAAGLTEVIRAHKRHSLTGPQPLEFIGPMNGPGKLGQHSGSDGLESLGFSQGVHALPITSVSE